MINKRIHTPTFVSIVGPSLYPICSFILVMKLGSGGLTNPTFLLFDIAICILLLKQYADNITQLVKFMCQNELILVSILASPNCCTIIHCKNEYLIYELILPQKNKICSNPCEIHWFFHNQDQRAVQSIDLCQSASNHHATWAMKMSFDNEVLMQSLQ
jgi:hypothetical protein